MKIYKDKDLKEEVKAIDFGVVEAGTSKEQTYYVLNDSKAILTNLKFDLKANDPTVKVTSAPATIQPGEVGQLTVKWSPSINLKRGLKVALDVTGDEVYTSLTAVEG